MLVGTVVGNVWATRKDATLEGVRFLLVRPFTLHEVDPDEGARRTSAEAVVAVDPIGAGIGERVLVVYGRAARHAIGKGHDVGFQAAVVGIIDRMELDGGRTVGPHTEWDDAPDGGASTGQDT